MRAYVVRRARGERVELTIKYRPAGERVWRMRSATAVAREFKLGLQVRTMREAERVARRVNELLEGEQRLMDAEAIRPAFETPIATAVADFVQDGTTHKAPRTAHDRRIQTHNFVEFCANHGVKATGQVTPEVLRAFRDWSVTRPRRKFNGTAVVDIEGKRKPGAVNVTLRVIRTFLTHGENIGWWRVPLPRLARELKLVRREHTAPAIITKERAAALLLAALALDEEKRERHGQDAGWPYTTFVAVGLCCPLRPDELLHLAWSDVVLDGADERPHLAIRFKGGWGPKTRRERQVPLGHTPQLLELLTELRKQAQRSASADARQWLVCSHQATAGVELAAERARSGPARPQPVAERGGVACCRLQSITKPWATIVRRTGQAGERKPIPKDMRSNAESRLVQWKRNGAPVFTLFEVVRMAGHSITVSERHYLDTVVSEGATFEEALGLASALRHALGQVGAAANQETTAGKQVTQSRFAS